MIYYKDLSRNEYPKNLRVVVNAPEYPKYHGKQMLVLWIHHYLNREHRELKRYHLAFEDSFQAKFGFCQVYLGESQIKV